MLKKVVGTVWLIVGIYATGTAMYSILKKTPLFGRGGFEISPYMSLCIGIYLVFMGIQYFFLKEKK